MTTERPIVIAGGGTGGHVYPGLALAQELLSRRPARPVLWIGSRGGLEERLVEDAGIPIEVLPLAGIAHLGFGRGLRAGWLALSATVRLVGRFLWRRPALAVGVGGFASGPAVLAALLVGVPTLLLEQNAIPGRTNRALAPFAGAVATSFEESAGRLGGRVELTGNPIREQIAAIEARPDGPLRSILAFGGSRGARALNEAWIGTLPQLAGRGLRLTLVTGAADVEMLRQVASESGVASEVLPYANDLPSRLAGADLVVARAGATTVAELTGAGRPALLVPFAHAADDHQRVNARALERAGAAVVIDPDELTHDRLASAIRALVDAPARLNEMARAARQLGRPDATRRVADLAEQLIGGGR